MSKSNQIDLLYLTNQNFIDKYNQKRTPFDISDFESNENNL